MNYKILDDMKTTNIKKVNYSITSVLCTLFSVLCSLYSVLCTLFSVLFVSCTQEEILPQEKVKEIAP